MADDKNTPKVSALHISGYGIVAKNKPLDSKNGAIEYTPVDDFPTLSGTITDNASQYAVSGTDASGAAYQDSVTQTATKPADWLPMGSNRMTAPDVRVGERVVIYRFGDADKYYWTDMGADMNLRKLETVVYAWSGTSDENAKTDASTSYFFEVSTHNKMMHVHTSKENGEVCSYDIQLNPGTGVFTFQDDIGTVFMIDSLNNVLNYQNNDGMQVNINKKDLTFQVPDTWKVLAKKGILGFTESLVITSPGGTTHNGDFNEFGAFGLSGDMVTKESSGQYGTPGTGQMTIAANMILKGNAEVTGDVSGATIHGKTVISDNPIQAPNV